MANIVLDFLHNYKTGERRESEPANAYQYDEGHVLEAVLPEVITACEIHYWIRGMEEAEAYTPTSITPNSDGSCTVLGNIPNSYFETNGELRVYIVVTDGTASITTYEGKLHICQRSMPDDYVDDDPENEATRVLTEAQAAATTATAAAQQAQAAASSAAAQASLANLYDATATYAVGDHCLYDGQLYVCTTEITTAEAWTAAHWTAVTVGGELTDLKEEYTQILNSAYVTDTASGSIASFPDGADGVPVKSLTVAVEPVQSGSGDPSPDNVRPISGHTQAVVTRTGKNLLNTTLSSLTVNGITFTVNNDGTITADGTATANAQIQVPFSGLYGNVKYTGCPSGGSNNKYDVYPWDRVQNARPKKWDGTTAAGTDYGNTLEELQIPLGHSCLIVCRVYSGYTASGLVFKPMIVASDVTDATYEQYEGNTYTINLGGTIYGGALDVGTGVLTVDRAIVDIGTLNWTYNSSENDFASNIQGRRIGRFNIICDTYKTVAMRATEIDKALEGANGTTAIFIRDTSYSDVNSFKSAMSGVMLVYELAEPITVQLSPQEVTSILGQNNIWSDAGDVEVEYRADTKLYIQKVLNA